MEIVGLEEHVLVDVFNYLQVRESEAMGFMVKKMALSQVQTEKFLSWME